jgi:hypothetical protein
MQQSGQPSILLIHQLTPWPYLLATRLPESTKMTQGGLFGDLNFAALAVARRACFDLFGSFTGF